MTRGVSGKEQSENIKEDRGVPETLHSETNTRQPERITSQQPRSLNSKKARKRKSKRPRNGDSELTQTRAENARRHTSSNFYYLTQEKGASRSRSSTSGRRSRSRSRSGTPRRRGVYREGQFFPVHGQYSLNQYLQGGSNLS